MSKLRKSARGQRCALRLPGVCNFNPDTTVLAHLRTVRFAGIGIKPPDYMGLFACSDCHDVLDGRRKEAIDYQDVLRAHLETLKIWHEHGLIKIRGE